VKGGNVLRANDRVTKEDGFFGFVLIAATFPWVLRLDLVVRPSR